MQCMICMLYKDGKLRQNTSVGSVNELCKWHNKEPRHNQILWSFWLLFVCIVIGICINGNCFNKKGCYNAIQFCFCLR